MKSTLTEEEQQLMLKVRDEWVDFALNSGRQPSRAELKEYVSWLYAEAGLKDKNPLIVICEGPMALQLAVNAMQAEAFRKILAKLNKDENSVGNSVENSVRNSVWNSVENSVRNSVGNSVRNSVENSVENSVWNSVRNSVENSVRNSVGNSVRNSVENSVRNSVRNSVENSVRNSVENSVGNSVWNSVWNSVRNSVRNSVENSVRNSVRNSVWNSVWNSKLKYTDDYWWFTGIGGGAGWLAFYDYFSRIGVLKENKFQQYLGFMRLGIWSSAYFEGAAFICTLPTKVLKNTEGRLHSLAEPAVQWKSGEEYFFLEGVEFTKELWLRLKEREITPKEAVAIQNVEQRTVALRMIGYDIVMQALGAKVLEERPASDGTATKEYLYEVQLNDDSDKPAKLVRLKDYSTERQVLLRVSPECKTIEEARAWSFGMKPSEFKPMVET